MPAGGNMKISSSRSAYGNAVSTSKLSKVQIISQCQCNCQAKGYSFCNRGKSLLVVDSFFLRKAFCDQTDFEFLHSSQIISLHSKHLLGLNDFPVLGLPSDFPACSSFCVFFCNHSLFLLFLLLLPPLF
jgi:hypothetical protein